MLNGPKHLPCKAVKADLWYIARAHEPQNVNLQSI